MNHESLGISGTSVSWIQTDFTDSDPIRDPDQFSRQEPWFVI